MALTLEQQRAQFAWAVCKEYSGEHVNVAKGLPALIMNSGLMQVLAFAQQKAGVHAEVASHLRMWLVKRFTGVERDVGFDMFMETLMKASPADYQAINAEAYAWLKWLRQLAAARVKGD